MNEARGLLDSAKGIAENGREWPCTWWTGDLQEKAWLKLHEAKAQIAELRGTNGLADELFVHSEEVLKQAKGILGCKDPRVIRLTTLMNDFNGASSHSALAAEAAHLTRAVYDKKDESYAQSRTFRNRLIRMAGIGLIGTVLLICATALWPINLNSSDPGQIPRNWETPLLITLFGALGAFASSIPALSQTRGTRNPFNLPLYQLLLKLATGPLFAFLGIVMLQSKVITELSPAATVLELLVWATIFGSTQQAVTRLVDQRVRTIVSDISTWSNAAGESPSSKDGHEQAVPLG